MLTPERKTELNWHFFVAAGLLWGLAEAGIGLGLRGACGAGLTGAIMTGAGVLALSSAYHFDRRLWSVGVLLGAVVLLKLLDPLLLGIPLRSGPIVNPGFAFIVECAAFLLLVSLVNPRLGKHLPANMATGGLIGLVSAAAFPLAGHVTGVPVCAMAGTGVPQAWFYGPATVGVCLAAYPLGRLIGEQAMAWLGSERLASRPARALLDAVAAAALLAVIGVNLFLR